jgi:hypothetical protein
VTRLASVAACTAAAPCAAVPTDISAPRRTRDHVRWPGRLYVSETPASTSSVLRYRIATGAEDVAIGNAVLADGRSVALQFATALGLDPAGNLYVGDDPTGGEQALQEHVWTARGRDAVPGCRGRSPTSPRAPVSRSERSRWARACRRTPRSPTPGTRRSRSPASQSPGPVRLTSRSMGPRAGRACPLDRRARSQSRSRRPRPARKAPNSSSPTTAAAPSRAPSASRARAPAWRGPPSQRPRLHQRARHRPHQARPPRLRHQRRRRLPPAVHRRHLGNRGALHTRPEPGRVAMTPSQEDPP